MLTRDEILTQFRTGRRRSNCNDRRDVIRLACFFPSEQWSILGLNPLDQPDAKTTLDLTETAIRDRLGIDVAAAFEYAANKQSRAAGLMFHVVQMWLWVLGDRLHRDFDFGYYGLPLYKRTAMAYGFPIPEWFGKSDHGSEECYR